MAPLTPSSTKGSNKKTKSSASKKLIEQATPLLERRLSKGSKPRTSLLSNEINPQDQISHQSSFNNLEDEEMDLTSTEPINLNQSTIINPSTSSNETQTTLTTENHSETEEAPDPNESNQSKAALANPDLEKEDEEDSSDEDERNEETLKKVTIQPSIVDHASGTEIIGGHIMTPATSEMHISAYPRPGELELFTINPLLQPRRPGFAPTANLPFELQLWWNLYSETHVSEADISLWAMVKLMNEGKGANSYEAVKSSLSSSASYLSTIVGPGQSTFVLIRFKNAGVKDTFRKNNRLDRGVYVTFNGPTRASFLIFNLEPVSKLTPVMSSLFVAITGLPFHLRHKSITEELYNGVGAHQSNDNLKLTFIREPNSSPTYTLNGGRIFEVHFDRSATAHWFNILSKDKGFVMITPWNRKGDEYKHRTAITHWKFLPTCATCGTSSHDGSHKVKCPYGTIRDDLFRSVEASYGNRSSTAIGIEQSSLGPGSSTFQPKMAKASKFTRHE
ncbi:uncharacterized protein MELLADRAFT_113932 [Melampsora larici-populina 98AG31]|uniref:Uncharacterized protein n=1 Tax=Melampsora larici-populina (strain 98AG31 / pathotype 3-4-7) TaxID=747676 RepID=F4SBJ9_MELLP|nr:uncharacterized protein MELLADRAFT_113932 [Melampsora larici-populina 98AG31]EGF97969.1 hypothetical protein MELLADRAFT_113932 [Melampsora larici-populina 98AG31]